MALGMKIFVFPFSLMIFLALGYMVAGLPFTDAERLIAVVALMFIPISGLLFAIRA
jgi:hypothetical protein